MARTHSSPIEKLPPELLSRTFAMLSSQNPLVDIANSRLVCKAFRALSSPYLLTTVVIAERKEAFQKLRQVMDHPYFRQHVTHLVWDASSWRQEAASDLGDYESEYSQRPGSWHTSGADQQSLDDSAAFDSLYHYDPRNQQARQPPGRQDQDIDPTDGEIYDRMRIVDGFALYHRRYMNQISSRNRRLAWRYLHLCFVQFPKLRHLSVTDYRALSRHGECYRQLCQRLFGDTLAPEAMTNNDPTHFAQLLTQLMLIKPSLESLSIGQNNFNLPELPRSLDEQHEDEVGDFSNVPCIPSAVYMLPEDKDAWFTLLAHVRSLRLPIDTEEFDPADLSTEEEKAERLSKIVSNTAELLRHAPRLVHLGFATNNCGSTAFSPIVSSLEFKYLRSIEIRGWAFSLVDLENFLFRHAETLRYLHIINCSFEGGSYTPVYARVLERVRREWPLHLHLAGVEIVGLTFYADEVLDAHLGKHICIHNKEDTDDEEEEDVAVDEQQHPFAWCPAQRSELENAMLGGRGNSISRQAHCDPIGPNGGKWWTTPVYFC